MPAYIAVLSDGTFAVADMTASSVTVFDVFDRSGMHVTTDELSRPGTETWTFRFAGDRALAWSTDPVDGIQRAYLLDLPTIS